MLICTLMVFAGCGGSLSDEQRKQIREGLEEQKIVKVSEAEIMAEAMQKGQAVLSELQRNSDPDRATAIARSQKVKITFLTPGNTNARAIEQELIQAYITSMATGASAENIQKIWTSDERKDYDSLLFSKPSIKTSSDGIEELEGIWNIYMARKDLVLEIAREK